MIGEGFGMGFGGGFMWLFWIILVILIVWALKAVAGNSSSSPENRKSALEILKERYAKGEIDQQEYELKRKELAGH